MEQLYRPSDDIRLYECTANEPAENWGSKAAGYIKIKIVPC